MSKINNKEKIELEALSYHSEGKPGKVEINPTKTLNTQRDLSLAYSPGVAFPCLEINKNPDAAYEYTAKGNHVAVITNGSAVLGLGNLGALASKPVMEGKSVLFKRFADIDSVDIEVETQDPDEFINVVKNLGASWGGINLEDIKAPECFYIEKKLRDIMDIPVFHDDQHGTAIISTAGIINALYLTNRKIENVKIVINGAGAAAIACLELLKRIGLKDKNIILNDEDGVVYKGRQKNMDQWKEKHAIDTECRTLSDAMKGTDIFLGLSVGNCVTQNMISLMNDNPIVFAMANPNPEIKPELVYEIFPNAIVATGRSDYRNQVNNVMGFPYIFRGALDVRASNINEEMKIAAAYAIAELAREHVPEEVIKAYGGQDMKFGSKYIIPTPFDPRLISVIPVAVAKAAIKSGVAKQNITDWDLYSEQLQARKDPTINKLGSIFKRLVNSPKKLIFAEGEQPEIIRVAAIWRDNDYGSSILIGKEDVIKRNMNDMNISSENIIIYNASISEHNKKYTDHLYSKLQREGFLYNDCVRMVNRDRNIFAASMLSYGVGDALITGFTRSYRKSLLDTWKVIKNKKDSAALGISMIISKKRTVFIADTAFSGMPSAKRLMAIAIQSAEKVRSMSYTPRVAFVSFSNFGNAIQEESKRIKKAVEMLDDIEVDFEYDGEMSVDTALNIEKAKKRYPFCRLTDSANILICPGLHSALIATKLMESLGNCTVIGPILTGFTNSVQIISDKSSIGDILNMAAIAATDY